MEGGRGRWRGAGGGWVRLKSVVSVGNRRPIYHRYERAKANPGSLPTPRSAHAGGVLLFAQYHLYLTFV